MEPDNRHCFMAQSPDNKDKTGCLRKMAQEEWRIIRKSIPDSCSHTPYCLEDAKRRRSKESALPAHLLHQTCHYIYLSQRVRWKCLILCNTKWRKVRWHWHKDQVWLILMRLTHWHFNIVSNHIARNVSYVGSLTSWWFLASHSLIVSRAMTAAGSFGKPKWRA